MCELLVIYLRRQLYSPSTRKSSHSNPLPHGYEHVGDGNDGASEGDPEEQAIQDLGDVFPLLSHIPVRTQNKNNGYFTENSGGGGRGGTGHDGRVIILSPPTSEIRV